MAGSAKPSPSTVSARFCIDPLPRSNGREPKPGWGVTYTARVRITVQAGARLPLVREGTGAGHGIDVDLRQAHESAIKEAETDAMKRALMTFGNPFGLALYEKQPREVTSSDTPAPIANTRSRPADPRHRSGPAPPCSGGVHKGLPQALSGAGGGCFHC